MIVKNRFFGRVLIKVNNRFFGQKKKEIVVKIKILSDNNRNFDKSRFLYQKCWSKIEFLVEIVVNFKLWLVVVQVTHQVALSSWWFGTVPEYYYGGEYELGTGLPPPPVGIVQTFAG